MIQWLQGYGCCCLRQRDTRHSFAVDDTGDPCPPPRLFRGPFPFSDLPVDLQQVVVTFLSAQDALRVCQTSTTIRTGLTLKHRQPFRMLDESNWLYQPGLGAVPGSPQIATIIPIFGTSRRRVHSVVVVCEWCNLGVSMDSHGKSQLLIVAHGGDDDDLSFNRGTIVAESGCAPFTISKLVMSFRPKPAEVYYYLWYRIGGVQLFVRHVWAYQLVFEDPNG